MTLPADRADWVLRVADLPKGRRFDFKCLGDAALGAEIANSLGILRVDKFRLQGTLTPAGKKDWHLKAVLGATVGQPCVVTLAPVTTRIDDPVERQFLADFVDAPEDGETEMPEDDSIEPLGETIDLLRIAVEALALALPQYPRAEGAELSDARFTEPGQTPMTDEEARPFAGLKDLRDRLADDPE